MLLASFDSSGEQAKFGGVLWGKFLPASFASGGGAEAFVKVKDF